MTNEEKLACCIAVLEFLEEDYDIKLNQNLYTPKMSIMDDVLTKYFGDNSMPLFTEYINQELSMGYIIKDKDGLYKPFFVSQSRSFYREAISKLREIKIEQILNI